MAATHYDRLRRHVRRLMDRRGHPRRLHMSHYVRTHRRGKRLSRTLLGHRRDARHTAKSKRLARKVQRTTANHRHATQHSEVRRKAQRQPIRHQQAAHNSRSGAQHRQTRRYR